MADLEKKPELLQRMYSMKTARQEYEWMGYVSRKAYEGKHSVAWDKVNKRIVEDQKDKKFFNELPEIANQTDRFENFLLATDFLFSVIPAKLSDKKALDQVMKLNILAKEKYEQLQSSTTFSDLIHYALLDNVSFIEPVPTDALDDVTYEFYDFFDVLFNPTIKDWNKQKLVYKVTKRNKHDVKNSKRYNLMPEDYKPVDVKDFVTYKDVWMQEKYNSFTKLNEDETLLFDCYMLGPEEGLRIISLDGMSQVIGDKSFPHIKVMPIRPLRIYSGEWYQRSYVFRQIPLNRSLDTLVNRFEDITLKLAKGGWIKRDTESLDGGMDDKTGQVINYEAEPPTQIRMENVPNFFMEFFNLVLSLTDRYGISSIFAGSMPAKSSGLRSNKMIDNIKSLTQQNNSAIMNNLKNTIKDVMQVTFLYLYEMWDDPKDVGFSDFTKTAPKFVSEKNYDAYKEDQQVVAIPAKFKRFEVEIDNAMGYSLEARQDKALMLLDKKDENGRPIIPGEAVRDLFKLGAMGYVLEDAQTPMYMTPEFQELIKNANSLPPEQKSVVISFLDMVGQRQGHDTNFNEDDANKLLAGDKPEFAAAPANKPLWQQNPGGGSGA